MRWRSVVYFKFLGHGARRATGLFVPSPREACGAFHFNPIARLRTRNRYRKLFLISLLSSTLFSCGIQKTRDDDFLLELMKSDPEKFQSYLANKDKLEIQIIYTQINRDANNKPSFKSFYFNVDSTNYFYPASTVKLPLVLLALEKLNSLRMAGLDRNTTMLHDSVYSGQQRVIKDTTSENNLPSVAHYSKKILVVSDNDAFNRLYEFIGQQETNQILRGKGYNIRFLHRLERSLTPDQNRHTEAIRFMNGSAWVYNQPMLVNPDSIKPPRKVLKGIGYFKRDSLIMEPFDFTYKNDYPLYEQQEILKAILFPGAVEQRRRFDFSEDDRQFVLQYMSQWPRETMYPPYYKDTTLYDAYCKFILFGEDKNPIPRNIRIFNKVGDAYGYLIDNAYLVDYDHGVEFMLSAVINTNTDQIYNDGKYEYKTLGFPFMKNLGQLIYQYELKRTKKVNPDLSEFKLKYEQ